MFRSKNFSPTVLSFQTIQELLEYLLQVEHISSTFLICSTRHDFLDQVNGSISECGTSPTEISPQSFSSTGNHSLMNPILHRVMISKTIRLVFCPTVQHLRAYLEVHVHAAGDVGTADSPLPPSAPDGRSSLLLMLDIISLHRSTSEFAAQGVSRTLASAVEAAVRSRQRLVIVELGRTEVSDDEGGPRSIWDEELPLLRSTARSVGLEGSSWAGRTVSVARVVSRWFTFERGADRGIADA